MTRRISTGIPNLDSAIEGGFPEGSLILLAGTPGTGKTVFGMKFLLHGAVCCGEPGVLISFTEEKKALKENTMNHFKCSPDDFGDIEILDFVAVKEKGLESIMEMIIRSIDTREAKRLVIDSFTAMTTGVDQKVDARILAQVLGKLVKQTRCTTILITETPTGTQEIGMGVEEFVADGVLVLSRRIRDGRTLREVDILKLRGTKIRHPTSLFTLENGFQVFRRFTFKMPDPGKEFKPRPDTEGCFSSGSEDLDRLLGGGWRRGSVNLIEVGPRIDAMALLNLILITALDFVVHGNGFLIFDPFLGNANSVKEYLEPFIGEDRLSRLVRCLEVATPSPKERKKFVMNTEGEEPSEDIRAIFEALKGIGFPDKPTYICISLDAVAGYHNEDTIKSVLTCATERMRRTNGLLVFENLSNFKMMQSVSSLAETHLKLEEMSAAALLCGIKPKTSYHVIEIDTSKGYPDLRLTPIL